jgi:Phage integrase, N-terminal SAM-like domain
MDLFREDNEATRVVSGDAEESSTSRHPSEVREDLSDAVRIRTPKRSRIATAENREEETSMKLTGLTYDREKGLARFEVIVPGTAGKVRKRHTERATLRIHTCGKSCRKNCSRGGEWEIDETAAELSFMNFKSRVVNGGADEATPTDEITFSSWVRDYWHVITADMKPQTARRNLYLINVHLMPAFGSLRLAQIDDNRLHDLRTALRGKRYGKALSTYSHSTINNVMNCMAGILGKAVKRHVLQKLPDFPKKAEGGTADVGAVCRGRACLPCSLR